MPLRQREFSGLTIGRQMGIPRSALLQLLNFTELLQLEG